MPTNQQVNGLPPNRTMNNETAITTSCQIAPLIRCIRQQRVILDTDLAALYGVETRALVQALKRNADRFPADFLFQLTADESASLRSQFVISKPGRGGRRYSPYAFTEHGALMAANVLNSPRAVAMSVFVIRAFVKMREDLAANAAIVHSSLFTLHSALLHAPPVARAAAIAAQTPNRFPRQRRPPPILHPDKARSLKCFEQWKTGPMVP
jgi:hypothetical protein